MPIKPGLVSVTFRTLPCARIVELARLANLQVIEWGGDLHVPPGQLDLARDVGRRTRDAGLDPVSYGSYYVAGLPKIPFETILDTALALGSTNIRVWAGNKGAAAVSAAERAIIVDDIRRITALAVSAGISVSLERHGDTLTDVTPSTLQLLEQIPDPNLFVYWQPAVDFSHQAALTELNALLPRVSNIHVFEWPTGTTERLPLSSGLLEWRDYFRALQGSAVKAALLEFVQNDSEESFLRDAHTLHELLATD